MANSVNPTAIEQHPDLVELRARYERASLTPQGQVLEGLTLLGGLYLAISPWVVGFNHYSDVTINNLIVGIALAVLALGFASAYGRTHSLAWVTPLIGVWTIIAPWVILNGPAPTGIVISNVITGGVTVLFGIGIATMVALQSKGTLARARR